MKTLVLGSDSFSGSAYMRYLDNLDDLGEEVFGVGHKQIDINTDLERLMKLVLDYLPTHIVNFIAKGRVPESWEKPEDWLQTNLLAQTKFIDRLRAVPIERYVHVSTPEVYGSGYHKEWAQFRPSTPYAVSKAAMEMMLHAYFKAYKFPVVITRSANVYGPRQENRIIPLAMQAKLKDETLRLEGKGKAVRGFLHVHDMCSATHLIAEKGVLGEAYNIAPLRSMSIKQLVEKIGCKYVNAPARLGQDFKYHLNTEKLRMLGWCDMVTLDQGLEEVWKSISCNSPKLNVLV